jgi:Rod binding domain-containing protein
MNVLPFDSLPPINPALEPASVRNGNQQAKNAYQTGLAFEQMLLDQLSQEMVNTVSADGSGDGSSSDGTGDAGATDTTGLLGSDPASSTYAQMLPQILSNSMLSAGGTGLAAQIASSLDPAIKPTP